MLEKIASKKYELNADDDGYQFFKMPSMNPDTGGRSISKYYIYFTKQKESVSTK